MKQFLVINKINTDGDFSYPKEDSHSKICDTKEDAFLYIKEIMESLNSIDTNRDYLREDMKAISEKWLNYYNNGIKLVPSFTELGNQSIEFEVIGLNIETKITSNEEQSLIKELFPTIDASELMSLSVDEFQELKKLQANLTESDWVKLNKLFEDRYEQDEDYCGSPQDTLADLRSLSK